jgi:hypothetical protein
MVTKLDVQGVVYWEWRRSEEGLVPILVLSVCDSEAGEPVSGLDRNNFSVDVRGSSMGWGWCRVYYAREGNYLRRGFYEAYIGPPFAHSRWTTSMADDDCVFTVVVTRGQGRGQALASTFTPVRLPLVQAVIRLAERINLFRP